MPNLIHQTFNRPRVLLPVIHCRNEPQAMRQARLAHELGADGVFLINQGGLDADDVVRVAGNIVAAIPDWFVGVNLLGLSTLDMAMLLSGTKLGGLWEDAADVSAITLCPLYFGGVAFKYQQPIVPPERWGAAAREAAQLGVGVVTTSGSATGEPAPVEKAQTMRAALGDHALALASGVTPKNVGEFLPYVDAYLVATGIERSFGEFDSAKLQDLAAQVHAYQPAGQ